MNEIKIISLAKDNGQFDQTWGKLFRENNQDYKLFENLTDLNRTKNLECDIFIVENILKEDIKGCTIIKNLRKTNKLPLTSLTILASYAPAELYLFKNIDLRPDIIMPLPYNAENARNCYRKAIKKMSETISLRKSFENSNLNNIMAEAELCKDTDFSMELMAESVCKLGSFKTIESKLYSQLKDNMWPSYILAREYVYQQELSKFAFLIDEAKRHHGLNIGLSYLYLQGNVMIQSAESDKSIFTSQNNDYFNAPEFLYLMSKYEFKRNKFKNSLKNQLEYIKDKSNTSLENKEDYQLLSKYTDSYMKSEEKKDQSLISEAVDCFNDADSRNILDEILKVSSLNFSIRLSMLKKDYDSVVPYLVELIENHHTMIKSHPEIISDIIHTISNCVELSQLKEKLTSNKKLNDLINISKIEINPKLKNLIVDANIKIKENDYSEAEMILSKILKNDPGNLDASFMMAETKLYFASLTNNYTRSKFVSMAMQVLEDCKFPFTEWQIEKKIELVQKADKLF
jgi:hypothetical protein